MAIIFIYGFKSPESAGNGVVAVGDQAVNGVSGESAPNEGDEILKILSALNKVNLKTDFFEDKLFLSLEDLSVPPTEGEMGRNNPFAAY